MHKKSRHAAGCLECLIFGQGSGVTPDRVETVLRSRLGQDYGNCRPASGPREAAGCRNRLPAGYSGPELDVAAETLFLSRRLSFRRLLWFDWRGEAVSQLLRSDNDSRGVVRRAPRLAPRHAPRQAPRQAGTGRDRRDRRDRRGNCFGSQGSPCR